MVDFLLDFLSTGWFIWYAVCIAFGTGLRTWGNRDTLTRIKWWIVWKVTPWFEERASLDLEWRLFAQKHNLAGKRPLCSYEGMEKDIADGLYEDQKAHVYEFPGGDPDAPPNCLTEAYEEQRDVSHVTESQGRRDPNHMER